MKQFIFSLLAFAMFSSSAFAIDNRNENDAKLWYASNAKVSEAQKMVDIYENYLNGETSGLGSRMMTYSKAASEPVLSLAALATVKVLLKADNEVTMPMGIVALYAAFVFSGDAVKDISEARAQYQISTLVATWDTLTPHERTALHGELQNNVYLAKEEQKTLEEKIGSYRTNPEEMIDE